MAGMKRLAKETAVYGLSSIIGRFLNWMLVPMYTRVLAGTGEYGIVTNLYGWTALLLVFLTYGMETGFFRFMNRKEEEIDPARVYASVLRSLATSSLLFCGVIALLFPWICEGLGYADHPEYVAMMAGIVAVDAFCCIPFAYLRYQGKAWRFAGIKLLNIFLNIFLNMLFLVVCPWLSDRMAGGLPGYDPDYGVGYVFLANVITTAVTLLLLWPDMRPGWQARGDWTLLKRIYRYSFPILLLGIAGIFNQTADKILFPFLFEDRAYANEQLGIYGACFKIAVVMVMFTQAFRYAYEPFIFARNKGQDNKVAYAEAMKYFILFALFIFLGVMCYLDILKYFVGEAYYPGLRVVPIVMLGEFFFGIYFNLSLWYKLTDQTEWGAYFSIAGCLATVAIILCFGPAYGYMACAWASFCCNLLMMLLSYGIGQRKYPIAYDLKSAAFYTVLTALLYAAAMLPEIDSLVWRLAYRTGILFLYIICIVLKEYKHGKRSIL